MSETKRERAKKILSQSRKLYPFLNCDDEFEQAFSDMDKMDKVEQIIKGWNTDNPRDIIHWEKIRMIEQILKGE